MTADRSIRDEISALKEERGAVILAHNYQVPEVQDIADLVGDSLELARAAVSMDCEAIVFCGVDFMAETAAILSPGKTVLHPVRDACCPMAAMVTADALSRFAARYPGAAVVAYVNTTAEVKAASDICCTSANAVRVVRSLPHERVIFVPDRNLAAWVARHTDKEIIPWDGYCIVHEQYTAADVLREKALHPHAEVLVHPECRPEVIDLSDHVLSTSGIIRHVCAKGQGEYIIGTETGIIHQVERRCPGARCIPLSRTAVCENMKKITLRHVRDALARMEPRVTVPPDVASRARRAIERMLAVG
ncbi:MAG: quinolinate synthase NadA [Methanolinea sp.]|nr:quinolinate synthase NadA [Methanolinea sp.]